MILRLAAMLVFASACAFGQSADSLMVPVSTLDMFVANGQLELDSIRNTSAIQFSSIKTSHDSILAVADEQTRGINCKIDSLRKLGQPAASLSARLDSILEWKDERINTLNEKVEKIKSGVNEKINSLALPPELEEKGKALASTVDKLDVTLPDTGPLLRLTKNFRSTYPDWKPPLAIKAYRA